MFGFGGLSEVLFILFLAMLIFGPAKMPEIARMLAKGMAEVRKASNELKRTLNAELAISEQEKEAARLRAAGLVGRADRAAAGCHGGAGGTGAGERSRGWQRGSRGWRRGSRGWQRGSRGWRRGSRG